MIARSAALTAPNRARAWISFTLAILLLVSAFSSVLSVRGVSAQSAEDPIASVVPASTVMYMAMNLDQESDQWVQTFDLMDRAGLNDVAENEVGVTTDELGDAAEANNFSGNAALVFTDADSLVSYSSTDLANTAMDTLDTMDVASEVPEVPEGFAMVVQPDDPAALSAQFVQMAHDEADSSGSVIQTVDYNGVTITYYDATEPGQTATATAEVDGTVILATRVADVEVIIDTVQGTTENLASQDGFNTVFSKLETDALVFGYMNLDIMTTAIQNDPNMMDMLDSSNMMGELEAGRGHAGWSMYASDTGFHMDTVMVPNDASVLNNASNFTPTMASKIPADVMMFATSQNFYESGISDAVGTMMQIVLSETDSGMYDESTPVATPTMDETWALLETYLGFNPDTDLLSKLDGEYAMYVGVYDLESDMPNPEFLFVSGTSDAETLDQTMTTVTDLAVQMSEDGGYEVSSRTVEGGELTVITIDEADTGGIPLVLEFGVVNDEMLIGVNGAIDKYLAGDQPVLADDPNFQSTFDLLPSENVVSMRYLNIEGQVMPLLDMLVDTLSGSMATLDNHEDCGVYATQEEAQAAYDADPSNLWLLDMNYNGVACEDYFGESTPVASPEPIASQVNMPAAGSVTWMDDDAVYTSSILVIGD